MLFRSDRLTGIGTYAFSGCESLSSISLPETLQTIRKGAFEGCGALTVITIPQSVTSIGTAALTCSNLTQIDVATDNASFCSEDGVLFNKHKTELVCYPAGKRSSSYSVPDSVRVIREQAFRHAAQLTRITIGQDVTTIRDGAFSGCIRLSGVTISNGLLSIRDGAFSGCSALVRITIPASVNALGSGLFDGCTSLARVTFHSTIGWAADGQSIDVTDPERNVTYLMQTYGAFPWTRR